MNRVDSTPLASGGNGEKHVPGLYRPTLVFVSQPQRLKAMKLAAMVISKCVPVCARAALLIAAVRNMMLLPAEAAVPALLENNSIAAEIAAGRTRVTARALISIGISRVMVVMASRLTISISSTPATSSNPRPILICRDSEMRFCRNEATTPPSR